MNANDLIRSLEGKWDNFGIGIREGEPVATENFTEILTIKDKHTLSIQCEGLSEGTISASEWRIELINGEVSMDQGSYVARGLKENNVYSLIGREGILEIRHRIFTLADKVIFLREIWKEEKVVQVDFSYLVRLVDSSAPQKA